MNIINLIRKNSIYLLLFCILLMSGCGMVATCIETPKTIRKAAELTQYTPLTVDKLSSLLREDTTHFKFVIFFSACCGPCASHMAYTYPEMMKRHADDSVKWYYIAENTAQLESAEQMMRSNGISEPLYYLLDTTADFNDRNSQKWNNIANRIFTNGEKVTGNLGIPVNFIVSKDCKVLKLFVTDSDNESRICTTDLYLLEGMPSETDFDRTDSISVDFPLFR